MNRTGYRSLVTLALIGVLLAWPASWTAVAGIQSPVVYPAYQAAADPAGFFSAASADPDLLLLKVAVFDPLAHGGLPAGLRAVPRVKGGGADADWVVVQFRASPTAGTQRGLAASGAEILSYIPNNALLLRADARLRAELSRRPDVRWMGPFRPEYKVSPQFYTGETAFDASGATRLDAAFMPGSDIAIALADLSAQFGFDLRYSAAERAAGYARFSVGAENVAALVDALASRGDVRWVEPYMPEALLNDNSIWVCQSGDTVNKTTSVFDKGIMGQDQVVAVADSGVDKSMCFFKSSDTSDPVVSQNVPVPAPLAIDPAQRKIIAYNIQPGATDGDSGATFNHGTHTAGSVGGDNYAHLPNPSAVPPDAGHDRGDGMAPLAKIIVEDVGSATGELVVPTPYYDMWQQEYLSGAHIASNSWGAQSTYSRPYSMNSSWTDMFVWYNESFLILFSGGNTDKSPYVSTQATGKNIVAVGAARNGSTGAMDVSTVTSKGPTDDGRIKPDVCVPGESIVSASGNFTHACLVKAMTGTSMACPTAAGLAALARQYFTEGWWPSGAKTPTDARTPSAALLKAVLVNSSVNMTGTNTGSYNIGGGLQVEDAPAMGQGWGRVTLDESLYFQGDAKRLYVVDILNQSGLVTGQTTSFPCQVGAGLPLKATLVWTDPPGAEYASVELVNDLDLELVAPDGTLYRGNQWNGTGSGGIKESQPNPAQADRLNNVEGALVKSPAPGTWEVRVRGASVPGLSGKYTQGFALVVTGDVATPASPNLKITAVDVRDESGNNNGVIDPGETVNVNVSLGNYGEGSASGVSAALQCSTPGIAIQTGTCSYPDIAARQSTASVAPLVFSVDPSVQDGTDLDFTLQVAYSGGSAALPFRLRVRPTRPPTLSDMTISEAGQFVDGDGVLYSQYGVLNLRFDYSDPDLDLQRMLIHYRVDGKNIGSLPYEPDALSFQAMFRNLNKAEGTFGTWLYPFHTVATATGDAGRIQIYAYLVDGAGRWSPITESNTLTLTQVVTAATPRDLQDDDSLYFAFPPGFQFPFYGKTYDGCWVNSDGNITFGAGFSWMARAPMDFLRNTPRIAPLYTDLAKNVGSDTISVTAGADTVTFSWTNIAQWSETGPKGSNTFSVTLLRDGGVDMTWGSCDVSEAQQGDDGKYWKAVVGISPGATDQADTTDFLKAGDPIPIPSSGRPVYMAFAAGIDNPFTLANRTVRFRPEAFTPVETLVYPRLVFDPGIMSVGYGFLNPGGASARVRFTAFQADGTPLSTVRTLDLNERTQNAFQAEEIFGLSGPLDAWVKVESDQAGLAAIFLAEKFSPSPLGLDGAAAFRQSTMDGVFPRVKMLGTFTSDILVANQENRAASVQLTGYDGSRSYAAPPQSIPPYGLLHATADELFPEKFDGYVRVTSDSGIVGNVVLRAGSGDISSSNLFPVSEAGGNWTAAHIAIVKDFYFTEVNLINTGDQTANLLLTPYANDGGMLSPEFPVQLLPRQIVSLVDSQLGLPSGEQVDGWLKVTSDTPSVLGCLTFGRPGDHRYESTLHLQSVPGTRARFAQVASGLVGGVNYFTGLSILNPGEEATGISITVYGEDGRVYGVSNVSLKPRQKYARLLWQLDGIGAIPSQSKGYILVEAENPVFAFELFGDLSAEPAFLSAVPGQ